MLARQHVAPVEKHPLPAVEQGSNARTDVADDDD
jgi:hypothetical protein